MTGMPRILRISRNKVMDNDNNVEVFLYLTLLGRTIMTQWLVILMKSFLPSISVSLIEMKDLNIFLINPLEIE